MTRPAKLTPMLEQYFEIKSQYPDAIVFYRLGDFYEMFFEDAQRAAPILDLVLTARGKGGDAETPMCGVPYHSAEQHIARLIRRGIRVAVCEQVEDPAQAKGLVRREVVRVITPGTAIDSSLVDRDHCYLLSFAPNDDGYSAAYLDVSTGDFFVTSYEVDKHSRLRDDLARFVPREIIHSRDFALDGLLHESINAALDGVEIARTATEPSFFDRRAAFEYLIRHFETQSLRGFGLADDDHRLGVAAAALRYAAASHKRELQHVRALRLEDEGDALILDAATLQNLEIFEARDTGRAKATLWSVLNATRSAMGARKLRQWIFKPLRERDAIFARHDAVDELIQKRAVLEHVGETLARVADLERLITRATMGTATPPECWSLARSLEAIADLRGAMRTLVSPVHRELTARLDPLDAISQEIASSLEDEPPVNLRDGGVIRRGVHAELDSLRDIARDSKSVLLEIEAAERQRTGITSLKVRFNSVFGYYIEISKSNLSRVPQDYIRKQTLVNAERFITPELKVLEEKIMGAEEKSVVIEATLFAQLLSSIASRSVAVLATAGAVGELDALASLANIALKRRYVRPQLVDETRLHIEEGRHPVIETLSSERFIPNDTEIDRLSNGIQIITGPNMGGKSTYLRQVALIVLMNQVGSFVPAKSATLGIFDRIFTRVGASDNLARGESTFMVEMHETANILHHATERSLIVLDEVGRGTATFDGLSLAWAIVEYLHDHAERSAITLFATHYHELTDLSKSRERVENLSVSVKEWNDQIIFLRKLVRGAADKSYGIQVAKLAGIPESVIFRAREILVTLERKERDVVEATQRPAGMMGRNVQLSLFSSNEREVLSELAALSIDSMSPIDALNALHQLKKRLTEI
jgi:DNA mismatch repair protein MutS